MALQLLNERNKPGVVYARIFTALQHKGAQTKPVACLTAAENLFLAEPVAHKVPAAFLQAAVVAFIAAEIGKFHNAANIDATPKMLLGNSACPDLRLFKAWPITVTKHLTPLVKAELFVGLKSV